MPKRQHDDEMMEHIPRLRRYARALTGDVERSDDLVQECLTRALDRFHLWRRGSDMRAWLFTIMHNLYVNEIRLLNRTPSLVPVNEDILNNVRDPSVDDDLQLRDLQGALNQLPQEQREVVLLVALEGLKYEEVAKILAIPQGTVMSRLHRGRERLRSLMAGETSVTLRSVK